MHHVFLINQGNETQILLPGTRAKDPHSLLLDIMRLNFVVKSHQDDCQLDCQHQHPSTAAPKKLDKK